MDFIRTFWRIVLFKTAAHTVLFMVLGAIYEEMGGRMVYKDIVYFLLISTGMGFWGVIYFEDHFRFFNNPRWCLR